MLGSTAPASEPVEIAYKEQQDFTVGQDGGYMSLIHSKIGQGTRILFGKLLNDCGKNELIPVYHENDALNVHLNREVKSEETHSLNDAEQCVAVGKRVNSRETSRAEQCARKSNDNSESRCSTHW